MNADRWVEFLRSHRGPREAAKKLFEQNYLAPEAQCVDETCSLLIAYARVCMENRNRKV